MKTLPALITLLLLAASAMALIQNYNHPTSCDACHSRDPATGATLVTFTTGGSGTCNPATQQCVWSHEIYNDINTWKTCGTCHSAIFNKIVSGVGQVHKDLQLNYGCACHAVAHVGYGTTTDGYTACIYFWVPKGINGTNYWGQNLPTGYSLGRAKVCFYGTPGSTSYNIMWSNTTDVNWPSVSYIKAVALKIGTDAAGNPVGSQAQLVDTDFFSILSEKFTRYAPYGSHPTTHTAVGGETIILGVFDIHEGAFILTVPYAPFQRYPYYAPVGTNPSFSACFNCHFVYDGQTGVAKVMEVGGVWKIGIPADVLNTLTDPHKIVMPAAQAAGGVAPNLSLVALLATATLLGGAFLALRRRAQ